MTLRSRFWRVVVVLFLLVNLFGAGYAAIHGELAHLGLHAGLLLLTVFLIWRTSARRASSY